MCDWRQRMVGLDLETTGVNPLVDRVVTAAVVVVDSNEGVVFQKEWITDPGIPIPEGAAKVHGITTERAQTEGEDYHTVLQDIYGVVHTQVAEEIPLVVFNAPYDLTMLQSEGKRLGLPLDYTPFPVVDPLILDRVGDMYRKGKRTLSALADYYQVEKEKAHDALGDVLMMLRVAWKIGESLSHPLLGPYCNIPLSDLQGIQRDGYRVRQEGYLRWRERRGMPVNRNEDLSWPIKNIG